MIIFDTDIVTLIETPGTVEYRRIESRIAQLPTEERVFTSVITYDEQTRGWLAYAAKARTPEEEVKAYERLQRHLENYRHLELVPFALPAVIRFRSLRRQYPRLGRNDLRIAAICLAQDSLLVSRNLRDFAQIEGMRIEDWTTP